MSIHKSKFLGMTIHLKIRSQHHTVRYGNIAETGSNPQNGINHMLRKLK